LVCRSLNGLEHTVQVWTSTSNDDIVNTLIKQLRTIAGLPPHGKCSFDRHRKDGVQQVDKQIPQKRDPRLDTDTITRIWMRSGWYCMQWKGIRRHQATLQNVDSM
jgi:aminoglycoside phosphotransferase